MTGLPPFALKESFGAKLRRLAANAANENNRADALHLMPPPAWGSGQTIIKGNVRSNAGSWYQAITGGTTGATAPTGGVASSAAISDGAVSWVWLSYASVTSNDPLAPTSVTVTSSAPSTVVAALTNNWYGSSFLPTAFRLYGDVWDLSAGSIGLCHGYNVYPYPVIAVGQTYALAALAVANYGVYKLTTLGTGVVASLPSGGTYTDANGNTWT